MPSPVDEFVAEYETLLSEVRRYEKRERWERRYLRDDGDVDTPGAPDPALWEAVRRAVPPDEARTGEWYLHLRELFAASLEANSRPRSYDEAQLERYGEAIRAITRRDERLLAKLTKLARWDALVTLRSEIEFLAQHLDVPPEMPPGWGESPAVRVRTVPFDERRHTVASPSRIAWTPPPPRGPVPPPRVPARERRSQRVTARMERIARLVARHRDGLSANAIRQKLNMGRTEVAKALAALVSAGRLERLGSRNDSRYVTTRTVVRKMGPSSPPKE